MQTKILKVDEVSDMLQISQTKCYQLLRNGKIPAFKLGGAWRIHSEKLDEWLRLQAKN